MEFKVKQASVKQLHQFLSLTGYYRRFVHDYAKHVEPLFALTKKDTLSTRMASARKPRIS